MGIIAVGVLLASSGGKKLLIWLGAILISGGALFLIGILTISFFANKTGQDIKDMIYVFLSFFLIGLVVTYFSNKDTIKEKIKSILANKWDNGIMLVVMLIGATFPGIIYYIIYTLIKYLK